MAAYCYSNQNSILLAEKQTHRSMEKIESPEINSHIWTTNLQQESQEWHIGEWKISLNKWQWENWITTCKNETTPLIHTVHKNQLEMN